MLKSKKPKARVTESVPPLSVFAYCTNKEAEARLIEFGIEANSVVRMGDMADNLGQVIRKFRSRGGYLVVAQDLRIFCGNPDKPHRNEVMAMLSKLERLKIFVVDIDRLEARHPDLIAVASLAISNNHWRDPRRAKRVGRKGGTAKGIAEQERRNAVLADGIRRRLCAAPELTWARKAEILGQSITTIKRLYKPDFSEAPKKRKPTKRRV